MAAHSELRVRFCQGDGIFKLWAIGHQRGGSDDAAAMGLGDGEVHALGKSEIIGVDDQSAQGDSLAGGKGVRRQSARSNL